MPDVLSKTFTAPKAYIKIGNAVAGYVRNLSCTENITRGTVRGLGSLTPQEVPALAIDCSFTVDQFFIDFNQPAVAKMINRAGSLNNLINTLSLGEVGFSIMIYAKTITASNTETNIVTDIDPSGKTIATLTPCFLQNQSFNVSEGQISAFNVSGVYLNPITT